MSENPTDGVEEALSKIENKFGSEAAEAARSAVDGALSDRRLMTRRGFLIGGLATALGFGAVGTTAVVYGPEVLSETGAYLMDKGENIAPGIAEEMAAERIAKIKIAAREQLKLARELGQQLDEYILTLFERRLNIDYYRDEIEKDVNNLTSRIEDGFQWDDLEEIPAAVKRLIGKTMDLAQDLKTMLLDSLDVVLATKDGLEEDLAEADTDILPDKTLKKINEEMVKFIEGDTLLENDWQEFTTVFTIWWDELQNTVERLEKELGEGAGEEFAKKFWDAFVEDVKKDITNSL